MITPIKKYLKHRPTIHDIICHIWISYRLKISVIWGSAIFYLKAKWYGVKCAGKVTCYGKVHIRKFPFTKINIGKNVSINSSSYRATACTIFAPTKFQTFTKTAQIQIGDNISMNGTSIVSRSKKVTIGSGTIIAPNVVIMDSDFHALWPPENRAFNPPVDTDKEVTIGKNVWIGMQSIILKGVTIGDNSIIGAKSVVTKDVPSNVVAAGNPAKIIKHLGEKQ